MTNKQTFEVFTLNIAIVYIYQKTLNNDVTSNLMPNFCDKPGMRTNISIMHADAFM